MKKTSLASAVLVAVMALSAVPVFAHAEETPSVKPSPKIRAEQAGKRLEERDNKKEERDDKKAEREAKKEEKKVEKEKERKTKNQERIQKFWEQMKKRLGVLIRNEKNLADRIEKRLAGQSGNTNAAELKTKLNNAKLLITAAETALTTADVQISGIASASSEPKDALKKAQELNKGVMEKIKAAHRALVEVVAMMKKGQFKPSPTPTVTVSPSPSPTPTPTPTPSPSPTPSP